MEDDSSERILKLKVFIRSPIDRREVEDDSSERILKQQPGEVRLSGAREVEDDSSERILKHNGDIDAIASAARQLADMVLNAADTCLWTLHADGYYETQCGQAYTAFAEGLDENHYRYCPSCGGTIVSASEVLAQMEDE